MAAATQLRYQQGMFLGRAPATCSLLSSAPSESQLGASILGGANDEGLLLTLSQHTQRGMQNHPQAAAGTPATGVGARAGELFEGLDYAEQQEAVEQQHQQTPSQHTAAAGIGAAEVDGQRKHRRSMLPLPQEDTMVSSR